MNMKSRRLLVTAFYSAGLLGLSTIVDAQVRSPQQPDQQDAPTRIRERAPARSLDRNAGLQQDARERDPDARGPRLTFETLRHDFGDVWDITSQVTTFRFTNTGDETLVIEEIKPSCGCTTTSLQKMHYEPGEGNEISVEFKPKGNGPQAKRITVTSNDDASPSTKLTIAANVTPFVAVEPRSIRFGDAKLGQEYTSIIKFTNADPNAIVQSVRPVGQLAEHLKVEMLPLEESVASLRGNMPITRSIRVTLKDDAPWGSRYGAVDIVVRGKTSPEAPEITHIAKVTVSTIVTGEIDVSSNTVRIGVVEPGEDFEYTIHLERKDGKPFEVLAAELERTPARLDMETEITKVDSPRGVPGYDVTVRGTTGQFMGSIVGYLNVVTDVEGEERLPLRVAGIVRELDPAARAARDARRLGGTNSAQSRRRER